MPTLKNIEFEASLFEVCERRLVLSAQLMFDVLGDHALDLHGNLQAIGPQVQPPSIESHLQEAHAATGWNLVQQQFGLTGMGQTVAVIDSGIAWDHVALGRGYGPGYRVVGGWDFTEENDAQPYDDGPMGFHGTHVSGIIGSDDPRHSGVAPDVDFVALRVFNDAGQGQLSWVERALDWVHQNKNSFENPITTVNLSLGTVWNSTAIPPWASLEDELQNLFNDGIVVTASAGNSFAQYNVPGLSYPAASPFVLPVASVDEEGLISDFSQRSSQVIAAPGRSIVSTVPDHVLGRDGKIDDFAAASGTSMSAPYVAGASVLVRQAMEMVGYAGINLTTIGDHLRSTADSVFDPLTGASYSRLNLERAIDTLIPQDLVGDTWQTSQAIDLQSASGSSALSGWINTLGDEDVFRFTPAQNGNLTIDANSDWLSAMDWSLSTAAGQLLSRADAAGQGAAIPLVAGQSYQLLVSAGHEIGSYDLDLDFSAAGGATNGEGGSSGSGNSSQNPPPQPIDLGSVAYFNQTADVGSHFRAQAVRDGTFTVQWENADQQLGGLTVAKISASGSPFETGTISDTTWENGVLRVDVAVQAGQWLDIQIPQLQSAAPNSGQPDTGELSIANVLSHVGSTASVVGTSSTDGLEISLQNGTLLRIGQVDYAFPAGSLTSLQIDGASGGDTIQIVGSTSSEKVDLRPGFSTVESGLLEVSLTSVETISYFGGGGPDRVYLYDSDADDILTARPHSAELVGAGYRFAVSQIDRIFVHASGGGEDQAFLYDSAGNDRLSVRPQFSSLSGPNYFNYVSGFERVFAYADSGGLDQADLYDSSGNDRFSTSGTTASIVGPGFSSFTRGFEQVNAFADSGGDDVATLYGSNSQTQWQQGSDFIRFREAGLVREARGFDSVQTFVAGQPQSLSYPNSLPNSMSSAMDGHVTADSGNIASLESISSAPLIVAVHVTQPTGGLTADPWIRFNASEMQQAAHEPSEPVNAAAMPWLPREESLLSAANELSDWLHERFSVAEQELLAEPEQEFATLDAIFAAALDLPSSRV